MANKIGRNTPCPCGSGKKYKRCCEIKELEMRKKKLPPGRFKFEVGSYGGPDRGYMPSIISYKEIEKNSWKEHFCLVKPDTVLENEDDATAIAHKNMDSAYNNLDGGTPHDVALSLRHEGYKMISDFKIISE